MLCMKAMGLMKIGEVEAKLRTFVAETNRQTKAAPKPFTKHAQMNASELLDMVARWTLSQNIVFINSLPPLSADGQQRIYPENVAKNGEDVFAA